MRRWLPLTMLIVPVFVLIALSTARTERQRDDSEVLLHATWADLTRRLGAPSRATYREAPTRVLRDEIEIAALRGDRRSAGARVRL